MNLTKEELLNHELTHRYSGNGYAAVEICEPTPSTMTGETVEYVRVTDKWCKSTQAFLARLDHLTISMKPGWTGPDGTPYPAEPIKLNPDDYGNLLPLREGLASGALKVVSTRFVKQQPPAATV